MLTVRDKNSRPLFNERDILDYIEENCGYSVKEYVKDLIDEVDGLKEEIRDLEDKVDDYEFDRWN